MERLYIIYHQMCDVYIATAKVVRTSTEDKTYTQTDFQLCHLAPAITSLHIRNHLFCYEVVASACTRIWLYLD